MVGISATMSQRVFEYVAQADSIVEELNESLPDEIVIEKIYDESVFVSEMFSNLSTSFFLATFFVLAFSFFFLGIRPGIIVTAILPFTVGLVLFGCNLIGLPLHQTSITGIIIALGLLIDNGIIVVEDYQKRQISIFDRAVKIIRRAIFQDHFTPKSLKFLSVNCIPLHRILQEDIIQYQLYNKE